MGLIKAAKKAIRWLLVGARGLSKNREMVQLLTRELITSEKINRRLQSFFEKTAKVEAAWGVHANFWNTIKQARKSGDGCVLSAEDVNYIFFFKKAFDDTIKPIGKKVVDQHGLDGLGDDDDERDNLVPLPPVDPDVPELTKEEADDGNLELGDAPSGGINLS